MEEFISTWDLEEGTDYEEGFYPKLDTDQSGDLNLPEFYVLFSFIEAMYFQSRH